MSCTGGTGSTILLRRSTTAGATPGLECLTVGELVLNAADGKLFTKGSTGNVLFTFSNDGSTADDVVLSVNGATGNVSFQFVSSFNGGTGAVQGVGSFNGATGAIVGVNSVNGATGAVTFADLVGVCSVNGFTGAVDFTTKTFHAAGFSTQGGITAEGNLNLAVGTRTKLSDNFVSYHSGVTIAATNSRQVITLGAGADPHGAKLTLFSGSAQREVLQANHDGMTIGVPVGISGGLCGDHGAFRGLTTNEIDVRGGKIRFGSVAQFGATELYTSYSLPAGYSQTVNGQPEVLLQKNTLTGIGADHPTVFEPLRDHCVARVNGLTGEISVVSSIDGATGTVRFIAGISVSNRFGEIQEFAKGISIDAGGITFADGTQQTTAALTDINTATFSIDASSGIATGAKTKALHRVPFDATLTKFEMKSSAVGFTGAVYVAGSDFGLPTTGAVTGCSLGVSGFTGHTTVFNSPTITAGNFLYFEVFNNTNGATNAQAFLTYTRR